RKYTKHGRGGSKYLKRGSARSGRVQRKRGRGCGHGPQSRVGRTFVRGGAKSSDGKCGDDQCDKEATYGHLEGEAQYCGTHYLPNMVDVTLGTSRRRRPSRKAEEEDSEEALPPRKPSPAENEQASTGKEKKKA
ncbi:unnamed protein product, partial [Pylaiella littoralis]